MRRKALIVLLALGTVGGYASGFASMRWCHQQRRAAFEQHVAQVCVDAARQSDAAAARTQAQPQPAVQAAAPVIVNVSPVAQPAAASPSPAAASPAPAQ